MKPGAPWSIKGVESDAREVAKAKARAADMTLGQWLNRAIAEADKPQPAAAAAAQPPGSSLDTARLMRAISEVARRVDQVRDSSAAPADASHLEAAIESIGRRLAGLERSLAAASDMSAIAERIDAVNARLDGMESSSVDLPPSPDLADALAPLKTDMQRMMNGMLNLARKIDTVDQRAEERLVPVREQLQARAQEAVSPASELADDPRIDRLREDIQGLRHAVEARPDEPRDAGPDIGHAVAAAMGPVLAKLADLERQIEQVQKAPVQPAPEPIAEIAPEPEPEPEFEPQPEPEPEPEPVASTAEPIVAEGSEPEPVDLSADETGEPLAAPDVGAEDLDDDDEPMQRPAPGAIQALHDLTANRQSVSRRIEPILRDLPTENTGDLDDDDRPDFDMVRDAADQGAPADDGVSEGVLSATPAPAAPEEPESFAAFNEDAVPDQPDDVTEPEPERQEPAPSVAVAGADDRDTDIPAAAAPPDRPRRIVPVESLLAGEGREPAQPGPQVAAYESETEHPAADAMAARGMDHSGPGMAASGPMAAAHAAGDAPRRRRGIGYLAVALIFLVVLVGGFLAIGDARFNDWVVQGRQAIAALTDMVPVGGDEPATSPETAATPAPSPVSSEPSGTAPAPGDTAPVIQSAPERPAQSDPAVDTSSSPAPVAPSEPAAPVASQQPAAAPAAATAPSAPAAPAPAAPAPAADALSELQARANAGDAAAQFQLGVRYRDGNGVGVSYAEAAQWFQRAAEQGNVPAQVDLGIFYRQGVGVAKDVDLAKVWFHAAARAGHPEAQNFLGQVYVGEEQERPDYFQAARWFREAAEQGVLDAQYNLASLYMGGLGVPRDDAQAYFWFGVAAGQGDQDAAANQENVAALISPAERAAQDQRIAAFSPVKQFQPASNQGATAVAQPVSGSGEIRRRDQIRLMQRLLIARGYDPGEPDGLPGEQTREAIRQFETDNAMQVTGKITETVLQALQSGG
ncbi:MAG: peptidoglycan-binding protein [Minwuia sp.]|nr:peptidoglycan-binding protein [Minwuia sp.]